MSNSSSFINTLSSSSSPLSSSPPVGGSPTPTMSSPTPSLMQSSTPLNSSLTSTLTSSTPGISVSSTTTTSSSLTSSASSTTTSTTFVTPTSTSSTSTTSASPSSTSTTTSTSVVTPSTTQPTSTSITTITEPRSTPTTTSASSTTSSSSSTSSTNPAGLQVSSSSNGGGGLSSAGTTAIAVVIPVVVVAILVALGIFFWRKRKQRKNAREERRKEVEEYGYNPNDDPTLPAVGGVIGQESPEMSEENGYRGWGNATNGTVATTRKASTNLSSNIGMAVSDEGNARNRSPGSPGTHPSEGGLSSDPLVDGTNAGVVGGAAAAGAGTAGFVANRAVHGSGINRGPSNASSTYSAAGHTDDSGDLIGVGQDLTYDSNYSQYQPYNPGAGNYGADTQSPIIRDVSARRNTKIENAVYPQPGNSGIAQNF